MLYSYFVKEPGQSLGSSEDMTKMSDIGHEQAHITFKAVTTVETEQGEFEAVISTSTIDRERDIVDPEGFVKALQKWIPLGKKIPLAWNHSRNPNEIIGHIDPASVNAVGTEVHAKGWVDYQTEVGKEVWRLVKSGTLGFSFGYLVTEATKRKGGGLHITGLDVFEVTATSTPMNGDTRVLGWKSLEELRAESDRLEREVAEQTIPEEVKAIDPPAPEDPNAEVLKELQEVKGQFAELKAELADLKEKAAEQDKEPEARSADPLRKRSEELALEVASGGMSLRKPPMVKEISPEPVDTDALKRESRDWMFQVLSYHTE